MGTGFVRFPGRVIEAGAKLGYHAPILMPSDDYVYTAEVVSESYDLAIERTKQLFELTQLKDDEVTGIPSFIMHRLLATPNRKMYLIDTIARANLGKIGVVGLPVSKISWDALKNVCDTAILMNEDFISEGKSTNELFRQFPKNGITGTGDQFPFEDRTWSWADQYKMYFVIRGYRGWHVNEKFCKVTIDKGHLAKIKEQGSEYNMDPAFQNISVKFWNDAYVPVGENFSEYAEQERGYYDDTAIPVTALWPPELPLDTF